jgi:hypothetical protein
MPIFHPIPKAEFSGYFMDLGLLNDSPNLGGGKVLRLVAQLEMGRVSSRVGPLIADFEVSQAGFLSRKDQDSLPFSNDGFFNRLGWQALKSAAKRIHARGWRRVLLASEFLPFTKR